MEPSELEIIPVCDIRLGELFRANPELEGKCIDIDTLAINSIVRHFNPEKRGQITFEVVHDDALNEGLEMPKTYGNTYHVPVHKAKHDSPTTVKVTVGGSILSFPKDIAPLFMEYMLNSKYDNYEKQPAAEEKKKLSHIIRKPIKPYHGDFFDHIAKQTGVVQSEAKIHEITVHELCHAAETIDERRSDRKSQILAYWRLQGGYYYGGFAVGAAINTLPAVTALPMYLGIMGYIGAIGIGIRQSMSGKEEYKQYRQTGRPVEAKAYQSEALVDVLPHVVSFQNKN